MLKMKVILNWYPVFGNSEKGEKERTKKFVLNKNMMSMRMYKIHFVMLH